MFFSPLAFIDAADAGSEAEMAGPRGHMPLSGWRFDPDPRDRGRRSLSLAISLAAQLAVAMLLSAALQLHPPQAAPWRDPPEVESTLLYAPERFPAPPTPVVRWRASPTPPPPRRFSTPPVPPPLRPAPAVALAAAMPLPPALALASPPANWLTETAEATPRPPQPSVQMGAFADPVPLPPQPAAGPHAAPHLGVFASDASAALPAATDEATHPAGFGEVAASPPAPPAPIALHNFDRTAPPPTRNSPPPPAQLDVTPPEILGWPEPVYTAAAAAHRVEGEVVLQVRLGADGGVTVLRIVNGLAYGLNDSAIAAARQLRFQPARRAGVTVDWDVLLHIRFRLAY